MKAYRIYLVGADGRLQLGHAFESPDDAAAGERAQTHASRGYTVELWEGGRMVGQMADDGAFIAGGR